MTTPGGIHILSRHRQQVGPVAVTFTIGRIQSRSIPAAGAGTTPVNLPAASDDQGGGLCVSVLSHDLGDSQ